MSYTPGTIVYAKLKGYPWWPARVEIESTLPSNVLSKKPKGPKPIFGVRFFGTRDYGWFGNNDLKPFEKKEAEISLQKLENKKRDKLLERSIREALDPSSFDDPMDEDVAEEEPATEDDNAELDEESKKSTENDDEVEYDKKSKARSKGAKKNKKSTTTPKDTERRTKASGSTKSKKKSRYYSSGEEEVASRSAKGGKKRRASEGTASDKPSKRKQRKIEKYEYTDDEVDPMDVDESKAEVDARKKERRISKKERGTSRSEGSKSPGKSDDGSPTAEAYENKHSKNDDTGFGNKTTESQLRSSKSRQFKTPNEKLLHLRHRLQRMALKSTEIEKQDMVKIDEVFTEVENFPITIPLLKESKIGKLMRKIAELKIEPDPFSINSRSEELIKKWKCLLEAPAQEGSDEETSPKTVNQVEIESPRSENAVKQENKQPLPVEQENDAKEEEQDHVESKKVKGSEVKLEEEPSAMDVEIVPVTNEEEKHMTDEVVTNGSLPAVDNQNDSVQENEEVHNKFPEL